MTAPAFCGNTARRPHLHSTSSLSEQPSACLPGLMLHAGRRLQSQLVSLSAWRSARLGAAPPCCAHLSAAGEALPCCALKTCSEYTGNSLCVCTAILGPHTACGQDDKSKRACKPHYTRFCALCPQCRRTCLWRLSQRLMCLEALSCRQRAGALTSSWAQCSPARPASC